MKEQWRPIVGWETLYEVSTWGRVRRLDTGNILKGSSSFFGYRHVRLRNGKKISKVILVHRLVAKAFLPNPRGLPVINHKDFDRVHNAVSNLEWCTQAQNLAHSERYGRMTRDHWKGKRSPSALMSDDDVRSIRRLYAAGGASWESIGKTFGMSKRSIGRAIRRETYADVQ